MSLAILQNKEPKERLILLSAVSNSLLPSPNIDKSANQPEIKTELIDLVINEIREHLNISKDDSTFYAKTKIVDFISQEISNITLSGENLIQVRERLGIKGESLINDENTLKEIYNAFEPNVPATPKYYVDCREGRDGSNLAKKIVRRLNSAKYENLRYLFTGHLGCGKSSELLHIKYQIQKATTFFPVYIDFEEYLDFQNTTLEDIFLGIFTEIADCCKNTFGFNINEEFYPLFKKIGGFLKSFSNKSEVDLPLDVAKRNIEKLRINPHLREQVRDAIKDNERKSLLSELNLLIQEIELKLSMETEFTRLVIIADSLEKIKRFENEEDGLFSQKKLFIDHAEQLTGIVTNSIYTIPLSLYRSFYGTRLPQLYSNNVFALSMVQIHKRGKFDAMFRPGNQNLIEIIKKRLNQANTTIEKVFELDALEYLLKYCGGHIRSLIRFIQEASISVDELPIDFKAARESVKEEVRGFAASVREEYWEKLAKLELSPNQQIENGDDDYTRMLEGMAILEYITSGDLETDDDVWYAVNPAIRLTIKFQEATNRIQTNYNKTL